MHKINSKDLMEIYTGYNKNKSIADIVNDEIDLFSNLFENKEFQDAIEAIDIDGDKSKIDLETDDDEGESIDNIGHGTKKEKHKPLKNYIKDKTDKKKNKSETLYKVSENQTLTKIKTILFQAALSKGNSLSKTGNVSRAFTLIYILVYNRSDELCQPKRQQSP